MAKREVQHITKEQLEATAQRRRLVRLDPDISGGDAGRLVTCKYHEVDSAHMREKNVNFSQLELSVQEKVPDTKAREQK